MQRYAISSSVIALITSIGEKARLQFLSIMAIVLALLFPTSAFATNVGINGGPCTYVSIQDAVAAASAGAVLYARPGIYIPPTINVNTSISIASSDAT